MASRKNARKTKKSAGLKKAKPLPQVRPLSQKQKFVL
jgi:hypothetical protein